MKELTDHDLRILANEWQKSNPDFEIFGKKFSFACGYRAAEKKLLPLISDAETTEEEKIKNAEAIIAKIRAATWCAFMRFEPYIESDTPLADLAMMHEKFCEERGYN